MTLRRRTAAPGISPALEHYLVSGCFGAGLDLDTFLLAGRVLGGHLDELRALWRDVGPLVKAAHPGTTFAEAVLALPDEAVAWREVAAISGRLRCLEHNQEGDRK
jgi:hypothetical protein